MNAASLAADDLIGHIYEEVSSGEAPWRRALAALCSAVRAQTLVLQMSPERQPEQTYFVAAGVRTAPSHIAEWEKRSPDQQIHLSLRPGRVITCNDYLEQRPRDGFVELIRRYDVARGMSARVADLNHAEYSLHALRPGRDEPFGAEEEAVFAQILPHLARAIRLRAELAAARADSDSYGEALSRVGIGMVRVDSDRRVTSANERAGAMLRESGLSILDGHLSARDRVLGARLKESLAAALAHECDVPHRAAIALPNGASALICGGNVEEPTLGRQMRAATMLIVADPVIDERAVDGLRALYALTATEAAVGVHLAMGRNAREIQDLMGIRYSTLRSHMSQLFLKLDCAHQNDLIRRLTMLLPVIQ